MKSSNLKTVLLAILIMTASLKSHAQISKVEIVATGLTCSMCSNSINKQLKSLSEVESIKIDLNTNTFIVYLKKENTITPRILKEKVEKAGFFVGSMTVTISFDSLKISNSSSVNKDGLNLIFVDTETKVLNGTTRLKILDKGFVTQKEYKKNQNTLSKYPTYNLNNLNVYHIINI